MVPLPNPWSRFRPHRWLVERSSTASDWREISRVLVLNLLWHDKQTVLAHRPGQLCPLTDPSPLIEGHPPGAPGGSGIVFAWGKAMANPIHIFSIYDRETRSFCMSR